MGRPRRECRLLLQAQRHPGGGRLRLALRLRHRALREPPVVRREHRWRREPGRGGVLRRQGLLPPVRASASTRLGPATGQRAATGRRRTSGRRPPPARGSAPPTAHGAALPPTRRRSATSSTGFPAMAPRIPMRCSRRGATPASPPARAGSRAALSGWSPPPARAAPPDGAPFSPTSPRRRPAASTLPAKATPQPTKENDHERENQARRHVLRHPLPPAPARFST